MAEQQESKPRRTAEELGPQLADAAGEGDLEKFKRIVNECGVDNGEREKLLNSLFYANRTLLHIAVEYNQVSIINWLLSNKEGEGRSLGFCKVLAKDRDGRTAFHLAVWKGHIETFHAVVNGCRVDNGERHEMLNAVDVRDFTILHQAVERRQVPIISWILSEEGGRAAGFDSVLARTQDGDTALHMATGWTGDLESFLAIVNGCRVDNGERREMLTAVDSQQYTILHLVVQSKQLPLVSWILSDEGGRAAGFGSVLSRTKNGDTALHAAARKGVPESFPALVKGLRVDNGERQEMLNAVDNDGLTILHVVAALPGCEEIISWILSEEGGRVAGFDSLLAKTIGEKLTALHCAVQRFSSYSTRALLSDCTSEERMNLFLAVDKHGWTALHYAARQSSADVLSHLLSYPECSLIVNTKDNLGMTALHRAIIGGLDEESRKEWTPYVFRPDGKTVRALLGLNDDSSSSSTTTTAKAWIDPNIGLGLL